jgi:hypothetical protein
VVPDEFDERAAREQRPLKLDLGGRGPGRDGFVSVNLDPPCDRLHDIADLDGLVPSDGVVDAFRLSHTLEHVHPLTYRRFLLDIHRKLRPGGELIVIQSDAAAVIESWRRGELGFRSMRAVLFTPAHRLIENALNLHFGAWSAGELCKDLERLGFRAETFDAGTWNFDLVDDLFPEETARDHGKAIHNLGVRGVRWQGR